MNFKIIYFLGAIILFLGLIWAFLPHAFHDEILTGGELEGESHLIHTLQGIVVAIVGIGILVFSNKKLKKTHD